MGLKAQGHSTSALVKAGRTYWGISEREVLRYLARVKAQEAQIGLLKPSERLGQIDARYQYLYAQAIAKDDHPLAHEILKSQAHLEQIRSKTIHNGDVHAQRTPSSKIPEDHELERLMGLF